MRMQPITLLLLKFDYAYLHNMLALHVRILWLYVQSSMIKDAILVVTANLGMLWTHSHFRNNYDQI